MVIKLYENTSIAKIASMLHISKDRIKNCLQENNIVFRKRGMLNTKYYTNSNYFKTWSHNSAYILGYTMADGCVYFPRGMNQCGALTYCLGMADLPVLEFINKELCNGLRPIEKIKRKRKTDNKIEEICQLRIHNPELISSIVNLGIIPRKTGFEKIPRELPIEYYPDFIRGFNDGDGCFCISKTNHAIYGTYERPISDIVSSSKLILEQIQEFIKIGTVSKSKPNLFKLHITGLLKIVQFGHMIYNGEFCLNRKYEKFLEIQQILYNKINTGELDILLDDWIPYNLNSKSKRNASGQFLKTVH